jgi:phosphotransferase system HPr-like phosphotransfer protein
MNGTGGLEGSLERESGGGMAAGVGETGMESPVKIWVATPVGVGLFIAMRLAQAAAVFPCRIRLSNGYIWADAKDALDLVTLGAEAATTLIVEATGERAAEAVDILSEVIADGYAFPGEAESESRFSPVKARKRGKPPRRPGK